MSALLSRYADILSPHDAPEPILTRNLRDGALGWLREQQAEKELAEVLVKPRRTCLLYGPPGCGKTTLAHHLAARLGVDLALIRPDKVMGKYLGEMTKSVAGIFAAAAKGPPVLLFFDEIDGLGGSRDQLRGGGADNERHNAMNVLLTDLERFRNGWVMAATNKQDSLDDALWRRFQIQMEVELPGPEETAAILRKYLSPFAVPDADVDLLTRAMQGASPALIEEVSSAIKRLYVLGPRLGLDGSLETILEAVRSQVRPHPSYDFPPFWRETSSNGWISHMTWPWERAA